METPARQSMEHLPVSLAWSHNGGATFSNKEEPLLAMREVSLSDSGSALHRHDAFCYRTRVCMDDPRRPDKGFQESIEIPGTTVWEEDSALRNRQQVVHCVPPTREQQIIGQVI
jgi:hypothetical protein